MEEEVEIKVVLKNPDDVEKHLNNIAKFVKELDQIDEYFVPKGRDYFSENPTKEYLRLRSNKGHSDKNKIGYHFCHFSPDGSLLKTDEYETFVSDGKIMKTILKNLGAVSRVTVTKQRKTFDYKDFEIVLDHIKELGYFLEVEAKRSFGSLEETKKQCYAVLDELNAKWEKAPNMGYPDMVLAKSKKK